MKMILSVVVLCVCFVGVSAACECERSAEVMSVSPMLLHAEGCGPLACYMDIWCDSITYCYTGPSLYTCTYTLDWEHLHSDNSVQKLKHRCRLFKDNGFWFPDALLNSEGWPVPMQRAGPYELEHTQTSFNAPDFAIIDAEIYCTCTNMEEYTSPELWFNEPE